MSPQRGTPPTAASPLQPTAPTPAFQLRVSQDSHGHTLATVRGEIDFDGAPALQRDLARVLADSPTHLDLDLSAVSFLDCAGLNALLRTRRNATATGCALRIRAAGPRVRRVMDTTDTTELFGLRRPGTADNHSHPTTQNGNQPRHPARTAAAAAAAAAPVTAAPGGPFRWGLTFPGPCGNHRQQQTLLVTGTGVRGPGGHPVYANPTDTVRAEISPDGLVTILALDGLPRPTTPIHATPFPAPHPTAQNAPTIDPQAATD
ncbi:STAS domain-containing protein [Kitasatospora sp. NBC_00374]|uniref:DUF6296 family protein n=1 Tax=Kitasatospora sp. NBC_00374 TaxID=2975964 RepID=UPI0030DFE9AB